MDQFFESKWFLRAIALVLALMLFISANNGTEKKSTSPLIPVLKNAEVIEDVEVSSYFDEQKYIVSGLPDKVTVELEGANSLMAAVKAKREFEVYIDLENLSPGIHTVDIEYRNISDQLKVKIKPSQVTVDIQEKVLKKLDIEVQYKNKGNIDPNFIIGTPQLDPKRVSVIGAKDVVEKIAGVKVEIDLKNLTTTFEGELPLVAYDIQGKKVDVELQPSVVNVILPLGTTSKTVPIEAQTTGIISQGYKVNNIILEKEEAVVFGDEKTLKDVQKILTKPIDLSGLKKTTSIRVPLIRNGSIEIDPSFITVTIEIEQEKKRVFKEIPIVVRGLSEESFTWITPKTGRINVIAYGYEQDLNALTDEDIQLYIDARTAIDGVQNFTIESEALENIAFEFVSQNVTLDVTKQ
ncbi:MAG: CdaR family protein [Bacilli bacterium]